MLEVYDENRIVRTSKRLYADYRDLILLPYCTDKITGIHNTLFVHFRHMSHIGS